MEVILESFTEFMPPGAAALVALRHNVLESAAAWARELGEDWSHLVWLFQRWRGPALLVSILLSTGTGPMSWVQAVPKGNITL